MPTPVTQPLPHVFPSPVPTQTVFPLGSLGSSATDPTALPANADDRYIQCGSGARASSVRQTPPPEVAAYSRQDPGAQSGASARAVVRPPAAYSLGTYVVKSRRSKNG